MKNSVMISMVALGLLFSVASFGQASEAEGGIGPAAVPGTPRIPEGSAVFFTDEGAFLGASTCAMLSLESFESIAATSASDQTMIDTTDISITTNIPPQLGVWNVPFVGAFATDGTNWMGVSHDGAVTLPLDVTLIFSAPISHFGISFTDYGDFGGGNLGFLNEIGDASDAAISGLPDGNLQFFGAINAGQSFMAVTLRGPISGEFYGIDELYYCLEPVPVELISFEVE